MRHHPLRVNGAPTLEAGDPPGSAPGSKFPRPLPFGDMTGSTRLARRDKLPTGG